MKKLLFIAMLFMVKQINAQWVTISDTGFVSYLHNHVPAAMNGNQMDTTSPDLNTITDLYFSFPANQSTIRNLDGIQYFKQLSNLVCSNMQLISIPAFPPNLLSLDCGNNNLSYLPKLPDSLRFLNCNSNILTTLPSFPNKVNYIMCGGNPLTSLPNFPDSLKQFYCTWHNLTSLPQLPDSLRVLACDNGQLTFLPPSLPSKLNWIQCDGNKISTLPSLPSSLHELDCSNNKIVNLPPLPLSLITLDCSNNQILCFSSFSSNISTINLNGNPYTCLPNYISAMDASTISHPLCSISNANGCPTAISCAPYVSFELSNDSIATNLWYAYPNYSPQVDSAIWYWGDSTSTKGLYPTHIYNNSGTYNICVVAFSSSCSDSTVYCQLENIYRITQNNKPYSQMKYLNVINSNIYDIKSYGINNNLSIYPNPSNGIINIISNSNIDELKITDILGQTVYEVKPNDTNAILQLNNAGIYFITTISGKETTTKKIIISK